MARDLERATGIAGLVTAPGKCPYCGAAYRAIASENGRTRMYYWRLDCCRKRALEQAVVFERAARNPLGNATERRECAITAKELRTKAAALPERKEEDDDDA